MEKLILINNEMSENIILKLTLIADKFLLLLEDFRNNLNNFQNNCKCSENIKNKLKFNELENDFKCVFDEYNQNKHKINEQINENKKCVGLSSPSSELCCNEMYVCGVMNCDFKTNCKRYIYQHNRKMHLNKAILNCPECQLQFWGIQRLHRHIILSHPNSANIQNKILAKGDTYGCKYTNCSFKDRFHNKVWNHIKDVHIRDVHIRDVHKKQLIKQISCEKCDKTFNTLMKLRKHRAIAHKTRVKYYKCDWNDCRFVSRYLNNLILHKNKHFEDKVLANKVSDCFITKTVNKSNHLVINDNLNDRNTNKEIELINKYISSANLVSLEILDVCSESCSVSQMKVKDSIDLNLILNKNKGLQINQNNDSYLLSKNNEEASEESLNSSKELNIEDFDTNIDKQMDKRMDKPVINYSTVEPNIYVCKYPNCEYKTKIKEHFKVHKHIRNFNKSQYKCSKCWLRFSSLVNLQKHIKSVHEKKSLSNETIIDIYNCDTKDCMFECKSPSLLTEHKKQHLTENIDKIITQFKSGINRSGNESNSEDEDIFINANEFLEHKIVTKLDNNSDNVISNETKVTSNQLTADMDLNANNSTNTTYGPNNDQFVFGSNLFSKRRLQGLRSISESSNTKVDNKRLYSVIKPANNSNFKCDKCKKEYKTRFELTQHMVRAHRNTYRFRCVWNDCQYQTNESCLFRNHMKKHSEDFPYIHRNSIENKMFKCYQIGCDSSFTNAESLHRHYQQNHN